MEKLFAFVTEFSKIHGLKLDVHMSDKGISIVYQMTGIIKHKTKKYSDPNDVISDFVKGMTELCTILRNRLIEFEGFRADREEKIAKYNSMLEIINNFKYV